MEGRTGLIDSGLMIPKAVRLTGAGAEAWVRLRFVPGAYIISSVVIWEREEEGNLRRRLLRLQLRRR